MSSHASSSPVAAIGKLIGAFVIAGAVFFIATLLSDKLGTAGTALSSHLWLTGLITSVLGMIVGIAATYAPNPLDHPEEAGSQFVNMFEWSGMILFFGGTGAFILAQLKQFNF
jgi:hypothetical protein